MVIVRSVKKMMSLSSRERLGGASVAFIPTMGALHEGHCALIRRARKDHDTVVVSIFVNPTQFGMGEDLEKYPRVLADDMRICRKEKVDVVFLPTVEDMYPEGYASYVTVEGISDALCGEFRPGHFKGVATVVAKLFNIVLPGTAYFGQKDAQQAFIIKKMADELNFPCEVKTIPTVRDKDGVALSSRNRYLTVSDRQKAPALFYALSIARKMVRQGTRDAGTLIDAMVAHLVAIPGIRIQYLAVVDAHTFEPVQEIKGKCLALAAVWCGTTRLIDAVELVR